MGTTFSDDQKRVIDARDKNILVSAAAGSGKTTVLVERILRRVTDPVKPIDIDRILVVTFTRAAAQEMKERIRQALEKELEDHPGNANLVRQSTLIHNAQINTIDGFCLNVVRNNFHRIGLDPSFRIGNDGEIKLLKKDVLKQVLDDAYEKAARDKDEEFYSLIENYASKDKDTKIEDSIMSLYHLAMSCPAPEKWLKDCKKDYEYESLEDFQNSELFQKAIIIIRQKLNAAKELFATARFYCEMEGGPAGYLPAIERDEEQIEELLEICDKGNFEAVREAVKSYKAMTLGKAGGDGSRNDMVKKLREGGKDILKALTKDFFGKTPEEEYESHMKSGHAVKKLIDLVLAYKEAFDAAKRERNILDFSDMEHMAIEILLNMDEYEDIDHFTVSQAALEYRDIFEEVMTDEYQDSNQVQEIILKAVSRENTDRPGNRFMVGDIKQSIYRFRLARPEIFNGKMKEYDADGQASEVIRLKENYRSRQEVVDCVNDVFQTVMKEETGGVEYDDNAKLYAKADFIQTEENYPAQVILAEKGDKKADAAREMEACLLADKILELVGTKQVYDRKTKKMRPAEFGDCAILFRGIKSTWRTPIKKAFDAAGIPYHMEGSGTFYSAKEVSAVLNFLTVLDNPFHDIALYGIMTSYFGGMTDKEAASVRADHKGAGEYLWDMLKAAASEEGEESKAAKLITLIETYRKKVTYTPIGELISEIVTSTGFLQYVTALRDGKQREANIELLIKKAQDYAKTSFSGLFHFIRYVELITKSEEEEGEANIFDEHSDTVRILTIHKSKGLEFPICIVADIDSSFNQRDSSNPFLCDVDGGIATCDIDPVRRTKQKTLKQICLAEKMKQDTIGEEIRIFYVAMTRAKEQLILFGTAKDGGTHFQMVPPAKRDSYLAMLEATNAEFCGTEHFVFQYIDQEGSLAKKTKEVFDLQKVREDFEEGQPSAEACQLAEDLKKRLEVPYSHPELAHLYTKTTVSALKMEAMEETQGETKLKFEKREQEEYVPAFAGGGVTISGTDRGTAYHKLMQLIDFTQDISKEGWETQFAEMVQKGFMDQEEEDLVPFSKIHAFGATKLAERMHEAAGRGELFKEQPFVMGVPASRVEKEFPSEETILVQGVIDVYFIEDDRVVVMDYKTDRVDTAQELVDRYKEQIDIYADALKQLTGKEVKEKLLYSFCLNEEISVT